DDLSSKESEATSLLSDLASKRTKIANLVGSLTKRVAAQIAAAAARAQRLAEASGAGFGGGGGGPVTLDHPFSYCPVQGSHAYSDSFGAPRYAGVYHPHAGNDIFAPRGTPIVAPFDGYASE